MFKFKISADRAAAFKNAPKMYTIYTMGYFVLDTDDGQTYIVDFPSMFFGNYKIIFSVYWENEQDIINAA